MRTLRIFLLLLVGVAVGGLAVWFALDRDGGDPSGEPPARAEKERFVYVPSDLKPVDPARIKVDEVLGVELIEDQLLVSLEEGVTEAQFQDAMRDLGLGVLVVGRLPSINMLQVEVAANALHDMKRFLESDPRVAAAGFNRFVRPSKTFNDPMLQVADEDDWGLTRIGAQEAWDITTGGARVAVVDSGALVDHEELVGKVVDAHSFRTDSARMQTGKFLANKDEDRWDFITFHGTHVSVTIGGRAGNGLGTAGIAPDSPIQPLQALYMHEFPHPPGGAHQDIVDAMLMAIGGGAQVVNMSLGADAPERDALAYHYGTEAQKREIDQRLTQAAWDELGAIYLRPLAAARQNDVIIVKSAGNEELPARWDALCLSDRVIGVAATDIDDRRSHWWVAESGLRGGSCYGAKATVSAPGSKIWSASPGPEKYRRAGGTSMAAPHVAGVVALMKTLKPDLTFEEVRDVLVSTGVPLATDFPIGPLVNAPRALREVQRRIRQSVPPPTALPPIEDVFRSQPSPGPGPNPPTNPNPNPPGGPPSNPNPPGPPSRPPPNPPTNPNPPGQPPTNPPERPPTNPPGQPPTNPPGRGDPNPPPRDEDDTPPPPPPPGVGIAKPVAPPTWDEILAGRNPWENAEIQRRIDDWLGMAKPVDGGRYDKYGRIVGLPGQRNTGQTPDWAGDRYRRLWNDARDLASTNHGTLWEYLHGIEPKPSRPPEPARPTPPSVEPTPPPARPPTRPPAPPHGEKLVAKTPRELFELVKKYVTRGELSKLADAGLIPSTTWTDSWPDFIGATYLGATNDDPLAAWDPNGGTYLRDPERWLATRDKGSSNPHSWRIVYLNGSWRIGGLHSHKGSAATPTTERLAPTTPQALWESINKLAGEDRFERIIRELTYVTEEKLRELPPYVLEIWDNPGFMSDDMRELKRLGYRSKADVRRADPLKLAADWCRASYANREAGDMGGKFSRFESKGRDRGKIHYRTRGSGNEFSTSVIRKGRVWKLEW